MKYSVVIAFFFLFSCKNKNESDSTIKKENLTQNQILDTTVIKSANVKKNESKEEIIDCDKILKDFIKKSNIKSPFINDIEVAIENIKPTKLQIRLFIKTPTGENSETTVGSLILDAENKILKDITNDLTNPDILEYKNDLWNSIIKCYFNNNANYLFGTPSQKNNQINWECIDKGGDVNKGFVTDCKSNARISVAYSELKKSYFDDGRLLLDILPKKDTLYKREEVSIKYKIFKTNKISIELSYPGGETKFSLTESQNKTNIVKTMFPD